MKRLLAVVSLAVPLAAQERVDFARQVLPVLEKSCWSCHKAPYNDARGVRQNPSGGLRLDGRDWIRKGGDDGPVLTPGKPEQSPLYTRTVLPADDDERMPKEGEPLSKEQSELLKRWIQEGAEFGSWQGAAADAPVAGSRPAAGPVPPRLAEGLTPLGAEVLARAAAGKARIEPIAADSPLLRVSFPGAEDQVQDADLLALLPLAQHVTQLVLARAHITDQALSTIARMPRLTLLDLRQTGLGDQAIARLAGLAELRTLNLYATKVTDAAVDTLARFKHLTAVHLWDSGVTAAGLERLRAALPEARVTGAPDLPGAEPAGAPKGRGRGKKK